MRENEDERSGRKSKVRGKRRQKKGIKRRNRRKWKVVVVGDNT